MCVIDYYAFGASMPGRNQESVLYRYGFNGMEKDANGEFGSQLIQDYGFRMYNPAIGKFLSVDPLTQSYPELPPYQFASNTPVWAIDLDGLEALLASDYKSLEELKTDITIVYSWEVIDGVESRMVVLGHKYGDQEVLSFLREGITQDDLKDIQGAPFLDQVKFIFSDPYALNAAINRNELKGVLYLARRKNKAFGVVDVAFFDLAKLMSGNIIKEDLARMTNREKSEKGYLNTFNHFIGQAIITSIYSEHIADLTADLHERGQMPELITGNFSEAQLNDLENGPLDNYVDMINNEWGQELGKKLKDKYNINSDTKWTPELLADYLNDVGGYFENTFDIKIDDFTPSDEAVKNFTKKLNNINRVYVYQISMFMRARIRETPLA